MGSVQLGKLGSFCNFHHFISPGSLHRQSQARDGRVARAPWADIRYLRSIDNRKIHSPAATEIPVAPP
jgi:hypothetical protein